MKGKLPLIVVFIFILFAMFFLFPRGCPRTNESPRPGNVYVPGPGSVYYA